MKVYPVKKYYLTEQKKLEAEGYAVFSNEFFEQALLNFLSSLGQLAQQTTLQANRRSLMMAYVGGFRALLGVGIALQAQEDISQPQISHQNESLTTLYFDIYEKALALRYTLKDHSFYALFASYLALGSYLDINFEDINYVYENEK